MRKLIIDQMEQIEIILVLDDLTAPGRITAIIVVVWRGGVGVVEASVSGSGRKIETTTVIAKPARVAVTG